MSAVARPGDVLLVPVHDVENWHKRVLENMERAIKLTCPGIKGVIFVPGSGNITIFRPADSAY